MFKLKDTFNKFINYLYDPLDLKTLQERSEVFRDKMTMHIDRVSERLDMLACENVRLTNLNEGYEKKITVVKKINKMFCLSINSFGETIEDMAWLKYADGTYGWCNQRLIDNLLFTKSLSNTLGRNDIDIGACAVKIFGTTNHDFGGYCASSDSIVIKSGIKQRFLEFGMSGGKPLILDVIKSPLIDCEGNLIGTTGVGRDVTDEIFNLIDLIVSTQDMLTKKGLVDLIGKHVYLENDNSKQRLFNFYYEVKNG